MWSHHYQAEGYEVGPEMPAWLLLTVAGGLFTGLLLAMLIGFHLVENNTRKDCVHKRQQQQSFTGVIESERLCCLCGNVRNRKGQCTKSNGRTEAVKPGGIIQPLVDAACGKSVSSTLRLRYFGSQSSLRPGILKSLQETWLSATSFFKKIRKGDTPIFKGGACLFPADSAARSESVSDESPVSTSVGGTDSGSRTTITTTITTTTSPQNSTAPESCGVSSTCNEKETSNQPSQRRLVLEILMSTSGGEMPRATGVRLKMETSTCLDNLTNSAAGTAPGGHDRASRKQVDIATDFSSMTSGSIPSRKTSSCTSKCHSGSASRGSKSACHIPKQGANLRGDGGCIAASQAVFQAVDASVRGAEVNAKAAGSLSDELECFDARATGGSTGCGNTSNKMPTGGVTTSTFSFSANATKSKVNSHCTSTSKSKSKGGCQPQQCSRLSSALPTATACSVNFAGQSSGTSKAPASHQNLNNVSVDGLGSLRISLVDAGVKGKSVKECSKGVTDIASALAALNVDSIAGKGGITLGAMITEAGKVGSSAAPCSKHSYDILLDEEIIGEGSESEQGTNEGEEHQPVGLKRGQGHDEDLTDGKKEKKKKKHRGRRHKGKSTSALGTGCPSSGAREPDKPSTDRGGAHSVVAASSEVEFGCLCGTAKGGCHSSSCPYPFTCSGSMVQRKIKEQYDELVRSNAAKTLTLAQVGRFTTCLVEAKVTLQQKSETIQRRFIIAKSLLAKADKSSFDRLCGQIYGLENEQKKLEEDTLVYNRLQEQLKLSPAYLKMLEYGRAHFELQPNTGQLIEKVDSDVEELSFEELLAQEKKDSFWQKHGPARSFVQVS